MGECSSSSAAAKTSVWWDIDKCAVPRGRCDPHRIAYNVIAVLASAGYAGPVSIAAYGDAARVAPPVLQALSATGICLTHVPAGSKDTSDKRMLVDMLFWAFDNPPPGNYLLISGDRDLSDLLHRLRMKRYDILLVRPANSSSQVLAAAAKRVWLWESLAAGDVLRPESPPADSVLGCKLNVHNTSGVLGCKPSVNNSDTLKRSQNKIPSEYCKGDDNVKASNQCRVKPVQKYVNKASGASSPMGNQDQVESIGGVSGSSTGSTASEPDQSSVSPSSSSNSHEKVNTSIPLEIPLSKASAQNPVQSSQSRQVEETLKSILGVKPSTSTECLARNGTLDFAASRRHYDQTYQQIRHSEAQNELHSEIRIGNNSKKASNRHRANPLQKYVKKTNTTSNSPSNKVDPVRVPGCPKGSTTSEVDRSFVSSSPPSSSSETLEVAKAYKLGQPETSTLFHSSTESSVASVNLHQVRAPHESILGRKPSISVEHASRSGARGFNIGTVHYHPPYQQTKSSEAQNELQNYSNVGDTNGKLGNEHKLNHHQVYVKKTDVSSASARNELDLANGFLGNPRDSSLSHPSQSMSASTSCKSLQSAKLNLSGPDSNPHFSLSSAHQSVITDHLHQESAEFISGEKDSTVVQCTSHNGTFAFGVDSGHYHPTYQQYQSSLLSEQNISAIPHPHSACGHSHSINSQIGSSALPSAGHNGVSSARTQALSSGSTFQGLDDICCGISRLNISECSRGTVKVRPPFQGAPANDSSMGMPDISGHPTDLLETRSSFHLDSNTSWYLNHSSDSQRCQPLSSDYTCRAVAPPNQPNDVQNPGLCGEKPEYPPNSSDSEGTIGYILHALGILKTEKIFPTESNIADCISYGEMNNTGFDVKKALELSIRHQAVVMKKLVNDMPLFVPKDESLWKCVNVTTSKSKNPVEALDKVHKYMSSTDGHSAIKNSQSRYQAATILKKSCLQHYALGDILQVLHIMIVRKKWLMPHSSGWQPLSLNTTLVIATTDATGKVKS